MSATEDFLRDMVLFAIANAESIHETFQPLSALTSSLMAGKFPRKTVNLSLRCSATGAYWKVHSQLMQINGQAWEAWQVVPMT